MTSVGVASVGSYLLALTVSGSPVTGSGTIDLQINEFTNTNPGVVPGSGGGTINFLRADQSWAPVPSLTSINTWTMDNIFNSGDLVIANSHAGVCTLAWANTASSTDTAITFPLVSAGLGAGTVMVYIFTGTVSGLPTASSATDQFCIVTDATSPTYGSTVTGGGSVRIPVYSNGTNWICV